MNKLMINKFKKIIIKLEEDPEKNKEMIEKCIELIKKHEADRQYWIKRNNDYKSKYKQYDVREEKK